MNPWAVSIVQGNHNMTENNLPLRAVIRDIASYETTQETLAFLKILALGNREIEAGKVKPIAEIARRFRVRKITAKHK